MANEAEGAAAAVAAKPMILLVTGVSGSGKTTIGTLLADRLGWAYAEADLFHPEANVAKMAKRIPLDDADRGPWLEAIGEWIDATTRAGTPAVVTCSGLKRMYRDRLRDGRENVQLVYLDVDQETVAARLAERKEHFFPPELLASQFRDLELPEDDEDVIRVRVDASPEEIVERVVRIVRQGGEG